jgi:hypothetical protein
LPFDLGGLDRVIDQDAAARPAANRKWWTPWRRHDRTKPPPQMLRETRPTATRAVLALTPGPDLAETIRAALARTNAPHCVDPRLVLRADLALADTAIWEPAVVAVTRSWEPFVVRLIKPKIVNDRMLGLEVAGSAVVGLQHALEDALAAVGCGDRTGVGFLPMVIVGSTFDGLGIRDLHAVAAAIRAELAFPIEFHAGSVLCYSQSAEEYDLPLAAFPLGG